MSKSREKIIAEAVEWYRGKKSLYEQLAEKAEGIIKDILKEENISVHEVCSRAKDIDSFTEKIKDEKYTDPQKQITDLTGVRIITYVESDLSKVCEIIKNCFEVDPENSGDKSDLLGIDKVGYRSIHFICSLHPDRTEFPELKKFKGVKFEIQVRTILQHTWAEVEHDRNYKFGGVLPTNLQRRFKILAGVLELADRELNEIALEIDGYSAEIIEDTEKDKKSLENIPIDSTSLKSYLDTKFKNFTNPYRADFNSRDKTIIKELENFGVSTLKDLDAIFPTDFVEKCNEFMHDETINYLGLLRTIMMVDDIDKYFDASWGGILEGKWGALASGSYSLLKSYGIPVDKTMRKYGIILPKQEK